MEYLTQGTVQVEIGMTHEKTFKIWINPVQDFTMKHCGKDYIVFKSAKNPQPSDVKLFVKSRTFAADPTLEQMLTKAAFERIQMEIKVDFSSAAEAEKNLSQDETQLINIVSIKIPATL